MSALLQRGSQQGQAEVSSGSGNWESGRASLVFYYRTVLRLLSPPLASVHEGGTLTASCAISNHIHPPTEVEWRHNGTRMLAQGTHLDPLRMRQDAEAGADDLVRSLAVDTVAGRRATVSRLTLAKVDYPEAGNYTCVPIGLYEDDYDVNEVNCNTAFPATTTN